MYTSKNDTILLHYQGGLGNQMFIYAFKCRLIAEGRKVCDDIAGYQLFPGTRDFRLQDAFPGVEIDRSMEAEAISLAKKQLSRNVFCKAIHRLFPAARYYTDVPEKDALTYLPQYLHFQGGPLRGYWQSPLYFEGLEPLIRKSFSFRTPTDHIKDFGERLKAQNSVSVHVRAGDYLEPYFQRLYGGICTPEYYQKAIGYICSRINDPVFYVFSDDILWCKKNIAIENAVWLEPPKLGKHCDWEEMFLMSCCRHNIVANSSFSWWGAWLNDDPERIVIAPRRWLNMVQKQQICPSEWVRI